jgi:hypothetical protein
MILLMLCLSLALSGCAALFGDLPASSAGTGSGGVKGGDDPIGGGGGGAVDPPGDGSSREVPDPTVVDPHGQSVDRFTIGPDGRTVVVYWWGGNTTCFGLREVMVEVQNGTPIFTVLEGMRGDQAGVACTAEAVLKSTIVTLDRPVLADAAGGDVARGEPPLPVGATRVQPMDGIIDARPHAVTGYGLSADGRTLSVYYVGGVENCNGLAEASGERDGDGLVTVAIREGRLPEVDGACDEIGVAKVVDVQLDVALIAIGAFDDGAPSSDY